MKFLLGNKTLLIIERYGVRVHRAPKGQHFELKNLKGTPMHVLVPDAIERLKSLIEMADQVANSITQETATRMANQALEFHRDRTEELLKRVLRSKNASEAADLVATEISITEERLVERMRV